MNGDEGFVIGITMGDPAGIGPEIVTKLLTDKTLDRGVQTVVIGSATAIRAQVERLHLDADVHAFDALDRRFLLPDAINVFDTGDLDVSAVIPGTMGKLAGEASMLYNRQGARLAQDGVIDALITSPVTKASAKEAGYDFPGQAEYFSHLAGDVPFMTILIYQDFKAALFTTHLPLIDACQQVKRDRLLESLRFLHERKNQFGCPTMKIAVAALNPHGGESGTMGREEIDEIAPAIAAARAEGIDTQGPFPVNAIISPPYDGRDFDLTLALFHDQVVARMNMHETTTLTFGLPFIRTSVGHGSALDIAGCGIADPGALRITFDHTLERAKARRHAQAS